MAQDWTRYFVTNRLPEIAVPAEVDPELLALFRHEIDNSDACPYRHQADAFAHILRNGEVALVAGTAAGKTYAAVLPLFHKLFVTKCVRKVIFMYPTRALLEDQREILRRVAEHLGQKSEAIGEIKGGMTSAQLIHAMAKPIIVATPDALYWFFRKNVKFTMTLMYGLAQADEIVLDEAHLFTGLMLRNMWHFLGRLRYLRKQYLGGDLRIHYLTATATSELHALSPGAASIAGRSKCTSVQVRLLAAPRLGREEQIDEAVTEALEAGSKRILVVANSARLAHRLFLQRRKPLKRAEERDAIPQSFWETFGLVRVDQLLACLALIDAGLAESVSNSIADEVTVRPKDLAKAKVAMRAEYMAELACDAVEHDVTAVRRVLERYRRQAGEQIDAGKLGSLLSQTNAQESARRLGVTPHACRSIEGALGALAARGSVICDLLQEAIDAKDGGSGIPLSGAIRPAVEDLLPTDGAIGGMRRFIAGWMTARLEIGPSSVQQWPERDRRLYADRVLPLRRVLTWIADDSLHARAAQALATLSVDHSGVGFIPDLPGSPIALLYTGSMARYAREGLVQLFSLIRDRPVILLATSAVEVGVDFVADALITEECEASSFLQRLGRIGRRTEVQATAWVLVNEDTLQKLREKLDASGDTVDRDAFNAAIAEVFPRRQYLQASLYADALQVLVSRQIGRTGQRLADTAPPEAAALADQITAAGIQVEYGLRGTMPAVSLLDEGVGKDPFYILAFVGDKEVLPAKSPFEVATINKPFNALVFAPALRRIFVNLSESLRRCLAIAVPCQSGASIVRDAGETGSPALLYAKACRFAREAERFPATLQKALFSKAFPGLPEGACAAPHLLLAYGVVWLSYKEAGDPDATGVVVDADNSQIELPEQWYLVLRHAESTEEAWAYLDRAGASAFESEIVYDIERPIGPQDPGFVLLDKQAGAVWEVWETLRGKAWSL